ncbi:MAG: GatB/YqeY domain-containing protein [Planctomycetota bacterium]
MTLAQRIQTDLLQAMRDRDVLARDTLRMVISNLRNRRIETGAELDEAEVQAVLASAVKSRKDSAEQFDRAQRPELAEKELAEIAVIEIYLPSQLSDDETAELVAAKVAELELTTKSQLGQLMKAVMAEHRGEVDGKTVQRLAAELLDG